MSSKPTTRRLTRIAGVAAAAVSLTFATGLSGTARADDFFAYKDAQTAPCWCTGASPYDFYAKVSDFAGYVFGDYVSVNDNISAFENYSSHAVYLYKDANYRNVFTAYFNPSAAWVSYTYVGSVANDQASSFHWQGV